MQVVDIYCRSATQDDETDAKLKQQEVACRAYCAEHELAIGLVLYEVASGWTYKDRHAFDLIRARCRNGVINGLVVSHRDRLTRKPTDLRKFLEEFQRHHVTVYYTNDSPGGPMDDFIRLVLAEIERQK